MKKHCYFFIVPVSPVVNFWSISGIVVPSENSDSKEPTALSPDEIVDMTGAVSDPLAHQPVLLYDNVHAALLKLSSLGYDIVDIRPFQHGGFSVDVVLTSENA